MNEYLHWLKTKDGKEDIVGLCKAAGFIGSLILCYKAGHRKGEDVCAASLHTILRKSKKELTFIDPDKPGHGFTAKYF